MTPQEEKVHLFLHQFRAEDEFIAWCEGNGVKGRTCDKTLCLISQAIGAATGVDAVVGYGEYQVRYGPRKNDYGPLIALPPRLAETPRRFDLRRWPKLVTN